jgi:hypothetical protein
MISYDDPSCVNVRTWPTNNQLWWHKDSIQNSWLFSEMFSFCQVLNSAVTLFSQLTLFFLKYNSKFSLSNLLSPWLIFSHWLYYFEIYSIRIRFFHVWSVHQIVTLNILFQIVMFLDSKQSFLGRYEFKIMFVRLRVCLWGIISAICEVESWMSEWSFVLCSERKIHGAGL